MVSSNPGSALFCDRAHDKRAHTEHVIGYCFFSLNSLNLRQIMALQAILLACFPIPDFLETCSARRAFWVSLSSAGSGSQQWFSSVCTFLLACGLSAECWSSVKPPLAAPPCRPPTSCAPPHGSIGAVHVCSQASTVHREVERTGLLGSKAQICCWCGITIRGRARVSSPPPPGLNAECTLSAL